MRVTKLALLALAAYAVAACSGVAPVSTPFISTPVTPIPGSSVLPSLALPSVPVASIAQPSVILGTEAPSVLPTAPPPTSSATPKPTKKPTPTPSPTPTPTPADIEMGPLTFDSSGTFGTWYAGDTHKIGVYLSPLGTQDLPSASVKLVVTQQDGSRTVLHKDSGPLVVGDPDAYVEFSVKIVNALPTTIVATATVPDGFLDTKQSNNKQTVSFTVQPAL